MYKHNIEVRSRNHCCCGKAVTITYSECVSAYPRKQLFSCSQNLREIFRHTKMMHYDITYLGT